MRPLLVVVLLIVLLVPCGVGRTDACSTFCLNDNGAPVFGKNYDWDVAEGLVMVNKRDVVKTAMTEDNPARWKSRYGSVTFNQYGREIPCGGINEAGLVIELMWLDETEYPQADSRSSLPNLQWIQYHLDRSASVAEVIAGDADVRITNGGQVRVHFLVADRNGECASIEMLEGKTVVHTGKSIPARALTNHTYQQSLAYLKQFEGFGGNEIPRVSRRSLDRFVHAAAAVQAYAETSSEDVVDYAFDTLADIAQGESTRWSIVYDVGKMRVYFRTQKSPRIRYFDVASFDFSCDSPVRILDVNADLEGYVARHFEPYTLDANRALIESAFGQTSFLADAPAEDRDAVARYPQSTRCVP